MLLYCALHVLLYALVGLQFVRINGTVVGGLVGLLLYTISQWVR